MIESEFYHEIDSYYKIIDVILSIEHVFEYV